MTDTDWKALPVYMMDFEGSSTSGVVEYGVVRLHGGRITGVETGLCRPKGRIPTRDREVHGLGEEAVRGTAPFSERYERFVSLRREGIFAAHNRHAENLFLKDTWAVPASVPDWGGDGTAVNTWGPWLDTLSLYRALYPGLESYGLGELTARFQAEEGLREAVSVHCPPERSRPHCALYDALASSLLLLRLEEEESLRGRMSLSWLLRLSGEDRSQTELF